MPRRYPFDCAPAGAHLALSAARPGGKPDRVGLCVPCCARPAVGVSNFEPRHIEQLLQWGTVTPAVNQIELHAHLAQPALREYCASKGIVVEAYGGIGADGLLADPVLCDIAAVHRRTPAQVSLRHSLQRGAVVLAKSLTPSRIAENTRIFDFALTEGEMARLDALDMGREHGRTYWDNSDVP